MRISTRTRYGSRAMYELACAYPDETVSVKEIAERQSLSAKYLESIIATLKAAGLIRAFRGFEGGYALARAPEKIRMAEIFRALEGSPAIVECVGDPDLCDFCGSCPTRGLWNRITESVSEVLESTTLADLVADAPKKTDGPKNGACNHQSRGGK